MSEWRHVRFDPAKNITTDELAKIVVAIFEVLNENKLAFEKSDWDNLPDEIKRHFR